MPTDYTEHYDYIRRYIDENCSEKRRKHIYSVYDKAIELAGLYGADADKAGLAALFHDMFRDLTEEKMRSYMTRLNPDDKYFSNKNLAHGKAAAAAMKSERGITDEDVLNAVGFHTTGRPGMSTLEKIIYLADATEVGRDYPGVEELRDLARKNLDEACLFSMTRTIEYVKERGETLDENTVLAREYLIAELTRR